MVAKRIIGLGYKQRSGKDTVADHLVKNHGFMKMAFAEPLKAAAQTIFGFTHDQLYGDAKGEVDPFWGFTPRWALQALGTEGVRKTIREDVWEKSLERKLLSIPSFVPGVVIVDVRFHNEANMLLRHGAHLFRVDRPVTWTLHGDTHPSETAMDTFNQWTGVIQNDGTLDHLYVTVDAMLRNTPHGF